MQDQFGQDRQFKLIRHAANRGLGAAMMTGISAAETEIVAVTDSDCSYDPSKLWDMLPALGPGVAAVTASPYHKDGGVDGVPEWRLILSKGASALYRLVLNNKLATYTSCFRVYRRSAVERVSVHNDGFIGVAELLARLDFEGWRITEHPMVLEQRLFGRSKLKILKTVAGHLRLILELARHRLTVGTPADGANLSRNDLERLP
ncbi:MAG: glycosyltransferase, partial [Pseudomonadota bacterium]